MNSSLFSKVKRLIKGNNSNEHSGSEAYSKANKPTRKQIWKAMDESGWKPYEAYINLLIMKENGIIDAFSKINKRYLMDFKAFYARKMLEGIELAKPSGILSEKAFYDWFYTSAQKQALQDISNGKITYDILGRFLDIDIPAEFASIDTNIAPSIRTRFNTVRKGDVFMMYAKKEVTAEALAQKSPAFVICRPKHEDLVAPSGIPYVTRGLLRGYACELSRAWRKAMDVKTVGITGSVGKTTTSEMIGFVIDDGFDMYKIKNNQNTEKQIPGLIYNLRPHHEVYVQEAAGSFPGQLEISSGVIEPDVFVVTNVGTGHIGNYDGNREMLLQEKLAVERHASEKGIGILNGDDELLKKSSFSHPIKWFSLKDSDADYYASDIVEKDGTINFNIYEKDGIVTPVVLNICGAYNIYNALAAFGVGVAMGMDRQTVAASLKKFASTGMRQNYARYSGRRFYFDCYSITTESVKSCIDAMNTISVGENGRRILVIGDIIQPLGDQVEAIHRNLGKMIADSSWIDVAVMYGENIKFAYEEAAAKGVDCVYTDDLDAVEQWIRENTDENDLVAFKANHFSRFQWLIDNLCGSDYYFYDELCNTAPLATVKSVKYKLVEKYGAGIAGTIRNSSDVILPEEVNGMPLRISGQQTFSGSRKLESVSLPDSMSCISFRCFDGCTQLKHIKFGKNIRFISIESFADCTGLETVDLSDTCLETIDSAAFKNCTNLKSVSLPDSVKWIGDTAFENVPELIINCSAESYAAEWADLHGICHK